VVIGRGLERLCVVLFVVGYFIGRIVEGYILIGMVLISGVVVLGCVFVVGTIGGCVDCAYITSSVERV
jgi:hypothetical protein